MRKRISWFELKNLQEEEMNKEELIKKVKELEDEIETLHAELRMAYKEKGELQHEINDFKRDMVC